MGSRGGGQRSVIDLSTDQLRQLHDVHLELLAELRRLCDEHSLTYFALYGTMLGAIRHQGFIPWDDDLDLGMFRADFDRLCQVAELELSDSYFLQTVQTDSSYSSTLGKLRKNGTVYRELAVGSSAQHAGVFIDIFPLDIAPDSKSRQIIQRSSVYVLKRLLMIKGGVNVGSGGRVVRHTLRMLAGMFSKILPRAFVIRLLEGEMTRYNERPGRLYFSASGPYQYERETVQARWFEDVTEVEFDTTVIPVPVRAAEYLSHMYGDYMTFPPAADQVGHHDVVELKF